MTDSGECLEFTPEEMAERVPAKEALIQIREVLDRVVSLPKGED